ncbi:MAG: PKD domain-containing protein [Bacteroidaceae bacterium]|nr:PKD domain-containing protein [Bacteroidaceae bacterium]
MKKNTLLLLLGLFSLQTYAQTQSVEVVEYHPAPGQFVNLLPSASATTTYQEVCEQATESLNNEEVVHLGTYGGYITVKFDHPIKNLRGSDLRITGNGFYSNSSAGSDNLGGSFEPGIVYVGVGDDVETCKWYELAGSEYYTNEIHDFSITYFKPQSETGEHTLPYSTNDNYIRWEASWTENGEKKDSAGYHMKISYHNQPYWPLWDDSESMTFTGGKVPNNAIDLSGRGTNWVLYRYAQDAYGYVDASLNNDDYSTFDIDWAVDADGNHVELEEVNFIKVMCGIFQYCGWLGETSTEISSFQDLHLIDGYDDNPIVITQYPLPASINQPLAKDSQDAGIYDLAGRKISKPKKGFYISNHKKYYQNN